MPHPNLACGCLLLCITFVAGDAAARTIYRCVRDGSVSLATAPEPGSRCEAKQVDDNAAKLPNLWGNLGVVSGTLYERQQDGKTVYSTRNLPGSVKVLAFSVKTPPGAQAHVGLGKIGPPRIDVFAAEFRSAAKATGIDDAWLRAIAHAESGFDANAVSPKGAQGVMQLMPATAKEYGVVDPFVSAQSIQGAAKYLRDLKRRYAGDFTLITAAYNAGIGTVARYGGVPPYVETESYVAKVLILRDNYDTVLRQRSATKKKPRRATQRK